MKNIWNNDLSIKNIGSKVTLYGWVQKKRNLGGLIFVDLRDRSGIVQLFFKPDNKYYSVAENLKNEYVIEVTGTICERENKNDKLKTGDIELDVCDLLVLNESIDVPFEINNNISALEDTRLKYRYLDIRRDEIKNKLIMRHKITMAARNHLDNLDFLEVETPILCNSTPEGARDYLVPSRISNGKFYALPQSPQIFKQLLMVGGIERYFQIAKCFRDEDLRADRQPEFTQIDVEMSFVNEDDVMKVGEELVKDIFKKTINYDVKTPLMRMKYKDAMDNYGSDKPDLRFGMEIIDITDIFKNTSFALFKSAIENNGIINCLVVKGKSNSFSRKDIDKLTDFVKTYKAAMLAYIKFDEEISGSVIKNLDEKELSKLKETLGISNNDIVFITCGNYNAVKISLGALRCKLGKDLELIDKDAYKMLWVTDFPSFEYSEEDKRYYALHHPFTALKDEDEDKLLTDPAKVLSKAYDIVINGYEAGGGSIRIHKESMQKKVFKVLGLDDKEVAQKFGFMLEAFKFGTPPHGGFALGLDRLTMLISKTDNIRDVIAFPKTASASCLMTKAPNEVDSYQLKELGIDIK